MAQVRNSTRSRLALALLGASALSGVAHAQGRERGQTLDEVIVTATKREETVQEIPFSITAIAGTSLERSNVTQLRDLSTLTPGLLVAAPSAATTTLVMRGAFTTSNAPGIDQDVAVFIDDVYSIGKVELNQDFYDLDRIEVLRGPQGTLFGRNVTGGAIAIHTRRPSETPEGRARVGYGAYGDYKGQVLLNGPLGEDVAGKLVLNTHGHDGYYRNRRLGGRAGELDTVSGRAQLLYRPAENVKVLLGADVLALDGDAAPRQLYGDFQPALVNPAMPWPLLHYGPEDVDQNVAGGNGLTRVRLQGYVARVDWETSLGVLTSISAYRHIRFRTTEASIGDPLSTEVSAYREHSEQLTQELRLASHDDGPFRWVGGVYFLRGERDQRIDLFFDGRVFAAVPAASRPVVTPLAIPGVATGIADVPVGQSLTVTSAAVFGEASYDLTPELTITLGARYTSERKEGMAFKGAANLFSGPPLPPTEFDAQWEAFTPKATLSWRPSSDMLVYATATRGFKSGSFDNNAPNTVAALQSPARPTYVWNYEAGVKADFLDGRLRANVSAYQMDYKDLQVRVFKPEFAGFAFENAAGARNRGVELEVTARPTSDLTLGFNYAYQDGVYTDYVIPNPPPAPPTDHSGKRMALTPRNTGTVFIEAGSDLWGGRLTFGASALFRSRLWLSESNGDPSLVRDRTRISGVVDAHATWTSADKSWEIGVWGRNITDRRYLTSAANVTALYVPAARLSAGRLYLVNWNPPATYGVTVSRRFW